MRKAALYSRVSTEDQKLDRQINELTERAKYQGSEIVCKLSDKISGTKSLFERESGSKLKKMIENGEITDIYVHEISRLSRNSLDTHKSIEYCTKNGVNIHIMNLGMDTLVNGETSPMVNLVVGVLASVANFERDLLSERTKSGLRAAKERGVKLGGKKKTNEEIIRDNSEIADRINKGFTYTQILAEVNTSNSQIVKVKRAMKALC